MDNKLLLGQCFVGFILNKITNGVRMKITNHSFQVSKNVYIIISDNHKYQFALNFELMDLIKPK